VENDRIKEEVREHYARIVAGGESCCGPACGCGTETAETPEVAMNLPYAGVEKEIVAAADLGLGCGTPAAFADLAAGMTVLDLGSGAGIDVFIAARAVGPAGKAIGVDMTDAMLVRAEANRRKLGIANAEFRKGEIEHLPVETATVDRVISNCVINLVPDKSVAFSEIYRALKPGGGFTVSDIVTRGTIPDRLRNDPELWAGCVAGALEQEEYLRIVRQAGFVGLDVAADRAYPMPPGSTFELHSITLRAKKPV